MDEIELMRYIRKDIILDTFAKFDLKYLLRNTPIVKLDSLN